LTHTALYTIIITMHFKVIHILLECKTKIFIMNWMRLDDQLRSCRIHDCGTRWMHDIVGQAWASYHKYMCILTQEVWVRP